MSLNCLSCQVLQRTDSEKGCGQEKPCSRNICCIKVERSWSGNLSPQPYEQMREKKNKKMKGHRRHRQSASLVSFDAGAENAPKLVRSSGMRRDWSFENLRLRCEKKDRIR